MPEPDGATPLDPDEAAGLKLESIYSRMETAATPGSQPMRSYALNVSIWQLPGLVIPSYNKQARIETVTFRLCRRRTSTTTNRC